MLPTPPYPNSFLCGSTTVCLCRATTATAPLGTQCVGVRREPWLGLSSALTPCRASSTAETWERAIFSLSFFETVFNRESLCRPVRHGNILRNAPDETTMRLDEPIRLCAHSFTSESRVVEMTRRHCVVCATSKVPRPLSDSLILLLQSHARTHSCTHAGALRQ